MKGEALVRNTPNNWKEISLFNISFFSVLGRTFFIGHKVITR